MVLFQGMIMNDGLDFIVTKKTDNTGAEEIPQEQPQTFSTLCSAKRKFQNKANNYTVGINPFKKI